MTTRALTVVVWLAFVAACSSQADHGGPNIEQPARLVLLLGEDNLPVAGFTNLPSLTALSTVGVRPDWAYWGYGDPREPNVYVVSSSVTMRESSCVTVPDALDRARGPVDLCSLEEVAAIPTCSVWRFRTEQIRDGYISRTSFPIIPDMSFEQQAALAGCLVFSVEKIGGASVRTPAAKRILHDYVSK